MYLYVYIRDLQETLQLPNLLSLQQYISFGFLHFYLLFTVYMFVEVCV